VSEVLNETMGTCYRGRLRWTGPGCVPELVWMEENVVSSRSPIGENASVSSLPPGDRGSAPGWVDESPRVGSAERSPDRSVLLFSGGLDSLCTWYLIGQPDALYLSTGAPWELTELDALSRLCDEIPSLDAKLRLIHSANAGPAFWGLKSDGHIPYRNLWLVLEAAIMGYRSISLGALAGETSRDKTKRFARDTGRLLTYLEMEDVEVRLPVRDLTKTQLVREFIEKFPDKQDLLRLTRSCYERNIPDLCVGCGECVACVRRWVAMTNNGIEEWYVVDPGETVDTYPVGATIQTYLPRITSVGDLWGAFRNHVDLLRAKKR